MTDCEGPALLDLSMDTELVKTLEAEDAALSVALRDFSQEMALAVKNFQDAGIPVSVRLVVDESDGNWLHDRASARCQHAHEDLKDWMEMYKLRFQKVGMDFRPNDHLLKQWNVSPGESTLALYQKLYEDPVPGDFTFIESDLDLAGFETEALHWAYVWDERKVQTKRFRYVVGIPRIKMQREVILMLQGIPAYEPGLILGYGGHGSAAALGAYAVTDSIAWPSLKVDLAHARRLWPEVYVSHLSALHRQDLLHKVFDLLDEHPMPPYSAEVKRAQAFRERVQFSFQALQEREISTAIVIAMIFLVVVLLLVVIREILLALRQVFLGK
ncbi:hypothetical protein [Pontibacter sp. G13]|uniref:hypothetical protein n=1 Tax=Pontibacter sp. G13 TaxID=3074898 RepID=UPI00288AB271|nr:hypothetical protein [Pontibacter sp. G13]WNJ19804.1 hypothetical protein RJD25_04915 [Pontibacter sp. G13]